MPLQSLSLLLCFNPRPLTSGRRSVHVAVSIVLKFQSTPAHERATGPDGEGSQEANVSIHARSRAGDIPQVAAGARLLVSIHARSRAGDRTVHPLSRGFVEFQSTPAHERATSCRHRGFGGASVSIHARSRAGDRRLRIEPSTLSSVSIHARSRAGDAGHHSPHCLKKVSIHARSRAGDAGPVERTRPRGRFNPRPLTSGRRTPMPTCGRWPCFNPRPLTSGRPSGQRTMRSGPMFQSTPAHERATRRSGGFAGGRGFQSTPAHERATITAWASEYAQQSFNPRPLTSGRRGRGGDNSSDEKFQSTPAHERATEILEKIDERVAVSIHARSRAGDIGRGRQFRHESFQSTPAHERATSGFSPTPLSLSVSIHARSRAGDPPKTL